MLIDSFGFIISFKLTSLAIMLLQSLMKMDATFEAYNQSLVHLIIRSVSIKCNIFKVVYGENFNYSKGSTLLKDL